MYQENQNINKDMIDPDLIDVESLDYSDDQTWLIKLPEDSGKRVDIVDWNLSFESSYQNDGEYIKGEKKLFELLDNIIKNEILSMPDKNKFDSRTFVKPKKRVTRPSIQSIVEASSSHTPNKYLTYNKYNNPMSGFSPMLRHKTFNVDVNTENCGAFKDYASKRRSLVQDDDPQLEDINVTLCSDASGRLSDQPPAQPINIDLSQPANNLHNTFNKGLSTITNERGSLNMYQSGESLMRMSPPSLVSSLVMENSGNFNMDSMDGRRSMHMHREPGPPHHGKGPDSIDPMMTSMTLSILDEKDMSTSFLSQTTYPDHDSLMDSLPPSLVSSVNSSYVVHKRDENLSNIFSSATFTHLEQSEKLLSARPRFQLYNSFKRDSLKNSESYTKAKEESCQIDNGKILNENCDKKESPSQKKSDMAETVTLHYSNMKFRNDDKENLNATFEKDDAFYREMGLQRNEAPRNSMNVTLDKQELNEIIQARQKLSMARRALPDAQPERLSQPDLSPTKTIQLPNQTITVPRQSMDNVSELLSRRRAEKNLNGYDKEEPTRETPKRNSTFKKVSPKANMMDETVVFLKEDATKIIDINSATLNLIDAGERTLQTEEWDAQHAAMVGSGESTDTGTFSSSSPPDAAPHEPRITVASTPLLTLKKGAANDLLNLHTTISPIYDMAEDKSYVLVKAPSCSLEKTFDVHNTTVINSATLVKKSVKRDIMSGKVSPEKKSLPAAKFAHPVPMAPPIVTNMQRKTSLPTSKLRQYSSHKELSRIPGTGPPARPARAMSRRAVYGSQPALSPTGPAPPPPREEEIEKPQTAPPALVRQGTETLRRERPLSQLVAPKELRVPTVNVIPSNVPAPTRIYQPPPAPRPYSIGGASQLRTVSRPNSVPGQRHVPAPVAVVEQPRPMSSETRVSALPRPSRLPAPRRTLRPPSVYSVAPPAADVDNY